MHKFEKNEIAIAFESKQNRRFAFESMGMQVRGTWRVAAMTGNPCSGFERYGNMPDVPGHVAVLDPKARTLRVEDPLGWRENKHLLEEINDITKVCRAPKTIKPEDTSLKRNMSDDDIVTALWEMRAHVDGKRAYELTHGKLPKQEDILAMARDGNKDGKGRIRVRPYVWDGKRLDGTVETPFANDDELDALGAPRPPEIEKIPVETN